MKAFTQTHTIETHREPQTETVIVLDDLEETELMRAACRLLIQLQSLSPRLAEFSELLLCSLTPACLDAQTRKSEDSIIELS